MIALVLKTTEATKAINLGSQLRNDMSNSTVPGYTALIYKEPGYKEPGYKEPGHKEHAL